MLSINSSSWSWSWSSSIQFWAGFIPVNEGGWIYPTLPGITPTLHLARFFASSFFKPTLLLSFSTCDLHVFLGRPRFLFPFTLNSNAFLKTWPSSLLNTCPYHLTPFAFAIWTTVSFNPNISIRSSVLLLSISLAPHIALTIALSIFRAKYGCVFWNLDTFWAIYNVLQSCFSFIAAKSHTVTMFFLVLIIQVS